MQEECDSNPVQPSCWIRAQEPWNGCRTFRTTALAYLTKRYSPPVPKVDNSIILVHICISIVHDECKSACRTLPMSYQAMLRSRLKRHPGEQPLNPSNNINVHLHRRESQGPANTEFSNHLSMVKTSGPQNFGGGEVRTSVVARTRMACADRVRSDDTYCSI